MKNGEFLIFSTKNYPQMDADRKFDFILNAPPYGVPFKPILIAPDFAQQPRVQWYQKKVIVRRSM
jgi:hypothetical protein